MNFGTRFDAEIAPPRPDLATSPNPAPSAQVSAVDSNATNISPPEPPGAISKAAKPSVRRSGRRKVGRPAKSVAPKEPSRPAPGTLTRTKELLLAALKVWELKQGIRD
jgi:hypothetical protein